MLQIFKNLFKFSEKNIMFKNQYNSNPIVFSPDGQLLQLNFASKASERGNFSLSLKSDNHLILLSSSKLEQIDVNKENRILTLGNNITMVATGISKDGKVLYEILKKKKLEIENSSNRIPQVPEIANFCSKVISRNTYYSNMRPFGIKLIIIGFDSTGPSIFNLNVDGNYQRKCYSAQGKGANKVINAIENHSTELKYFSTDELMIGVFSIYFKSFDENEKKKAMKVPYQSHY